MLTKDIKPLAQISCEALQSILEALPDALFFIDNAGIVIYANRSAQSLTGTSLEEIVGHPLAGLLWPASPANQEQFRAMLAQASAGEALRFETLIQPEEHMSYELEASVTPQMNAACHLEYLIFTGSDITSRKQAEAELRGLIDSIPQLIWIRRADGSGTETNQRWRAYTGLTHEQAQGDGWVQCIHPHDRVRVQETWENFIQPGETYEKEVRLRSFTGEYRWFLVRAAPFKDSRGQIIRWFGTCTDIDQQKQTEQKLKESWEELRVLTEAVPQMLWTTRADGLSDSFNKRFCDYTGVTSEQMKGYGWSQFLHPDDYARTMAVRKRAFLTGINYEVEYRLREGRTGCYRWFLARARPVRDEAGQIIKWFGTCTDIDDRKRIEEALRLSQKRIRALVDSNIIGIVSSEGEDNVVVEANDAFLQMTGYGREDIDNRRLLGPQIFAVEEACLLKELTSCGQITPFEAEVVCKDGSRLPVLIGGVVVQEQPCQTISFVLDNSARKELEQRKDEFISMASHELRNPLAVLKLQTTLLSRQLSGQGIESSAPAFTRMENQLNKVTRLVGELLDVSRIQAGKMEYRQEKVNLDELLREVAETMQQTQPGHTILIHGTGESDLLGDRDRLGQVFTNLLSNAIKYSPDAKTVEVELSSSAEQMMIRVRDHGLGIPREQREKIFERFYRATNPRQRTVPGLGIGLYIVAEIVRHHQGTITVESELGKGSTFLVTLPFARAT